MRASCFKPAFVIFVTALFLFDAMLDQKAVAGPTAYIGLYSDESRNSYLYEYSGPYEQFDVWVWALPGEDGMICAEFSIDHHDLVWVIRTNSESGLFDYFWKSNPFGRLDLFRDVPRKLDVALSDPDAYNGT